MTGPLSPRWAHWYRRALPSYWIALFCLTHFPELRLGVQLPRSDKLAHILAFGLLAFLFWRFGETFARGRSGRFVWIAAGVLGGYAGLDEWLQQFVGRSADWTDFGCNLAGIALVLGPLEWRRRVVAAKRPPPVAPVDLEKTRA